jgi:hypothetical protein
MSGICEKGRFLKSSNDTWSVVSTEESEKKVFQALKYLKRKSDSIGAQRMSYPHHYHHAPAYAQSSFRTPHSIFSPTRPYQCNYYGPDYVYEECCDLYNHGTWEPLYGRTVSRYEPCAASDVWTGHHCWETLLAHRWAVLNTVQRLATGQAGELVEYSSYQLGSLCIHGIRLKRMRRICCCCCCYFGRTIGSGVTRTYRILLFNTLLVPRRCGGSG